MIRSLAIDAAILIAAAGLFILDACHRDEAPPADPPALGLPGDFVCPANDPDPAACDDAGFDYGRTGD